jgi:hypothetical protein
MYIFGFGSAQAQIKFSFDSNKRLLSSILLTYSNKGNSKIPPESSLGDTKVNVKQGVAVFDT